MELELLHGILYRLGQYGTHRKRIMHGSDRNYVTALDLDRLAARDKFLNDACVAMPPKVHHGHNSLMESGYSSHRESKSPSPIPPSLDEDSEDERARVWLVYKDGVLPGRMMVQEDDSGLEEPNQTWKTSVEQVSRNNSATSSPSKSTKESKSVKETAACDDINLKPIGFTQKKDVDKSLTKSAPNTNDIFQEKKKLIKIQLEKTNEILEVDPVFTEAAGSQEQETVMNLTELDVVNESEILNVLSKRFSRGEYQTKVDDTIISINPMQKTEPSCSRAGSPCSKGKEGVICTELLMKQTEEIYRKMLITGTPQSIVMTGRSGSGKTCNFKKTMAYLIETTQPKTNSQFTMEKLYAIDCILESFCSTRTSLNTHATRMAQMVELFFDSGGHISGGGVEMALPDTGRLLRTGRMPGEPTFPILYQIQAALGNSQLFLAPTALLDSAFFTPLQDHREVEAALEDWSRVRTALEVLGVTQDEENCLWIILAAITNIGVATAQLEETGFLSENGATSKVCELLGVTEEELRHVLQRPSSPASRSPINSCQSSVAPSTASTRTSTPAPTQVTSPTAATDSLSTSSFPSMESLSTTSCGSLDWVWNPPEESALILDNIRRLAINLYSDLLSRLISFINRSIRPVAKQPPQPFSIILFDSPGFQNPSNVGEKQAAGFVDLCYNYLQESLQQLFNINKVEIMCKNRKAAVKLLSTRRSNPSPMISLIERSSPSAKHKREQERPCSGYSTIGRRTSSKRVRFNQTPPGLLTLLHKAAICPWSSDETFVQRLTTHWGGTHHRSVIEGLGGTEFKLQHGQGTNPVRYDAEGWRSLSANMAKTNLATELLKKTRKKQLISSCSHDQISSSPVGFSSGMTLEQLRARMSCLQVKVQVDTICKVLSGTNMNFVLCLQPHKLAGLCELFRKKPNRNLNQKLLRDQLRGCQLLEYLVLLKAADQLLPKEVATRAAVDNMVDNHGDNLALCTTNTTRQGLATDLWNSLQVAVMAAITNVDVLESAVREGISRSIPGPPVLQALDDSGLLRMDGGHVNLNIESLLDPGL